MDIDTVRDWLAATGRNRDWLADQCGVSKRTVDGWLSSRSAPPLAEKFIERLMKEDSLSDLALSYEDWKTINSAMAASGYSYFNEFALDTIRGYAAEHQAKYNPPQIKPPLKALKKTKKEAG